MADSLSSHWEPCSSCSCSNHRLPSYHFPTENTSPLYLERLTHCNNPPSPTETDELKLAVLSYEQQIRNLTAEEEKLQKMLAKMQDSVKEKAGILLREKERASAAISKRKHVLSPVRRLPVEILFYIFLRTIEFPIRHTQDLYSDPEHPPDNPMFSIACVSKQWKMVAMSSPKLWSYVNIVLTDENFDDQSYARRLGEQCSYSRNHPLFVSIVDESVNSFPDQLAGILFTISRDIQELHLFFRSSTFIEFDQLRLSLPSLERLSLVALDSDLFDDEEKLQFFPTSSKLRTLEIVDINEPSGYFVVPWNQINTYKSSHSHMDDFNWGPTSYQHLKVLRELTQLEKCTLRCEDNIAEVEFGDEVFPLSCANLRSMKISSSARVSESSSDTALKQILVRLILPELTSLKVDCLSCEGTGTFTAVRELIIKSHCPITVLHFDHGFILEEDLLHILRQTPTLEDVRLTHVDVSFDKTFTELIPKLDGTPILVPRLQTLHLGGSIVFDMEVVVNMVETRWNLAPLHVPSGQRLMEVSLYRLLPTDELSDEVNMATALSTLDVYMTQGLKFTFSTEYMLNVGEQ